MVHCQICQKELKSFLFSYRRECRECREARKQLKRDGVSLRAVKNYLKATGLQIEADLPAKGKQVLAEVDIEGGTVVRFRTKPAGNSGSIS